MKPVKQLNHIGIAVKEIASHRKFYEGVLGAPFEGEETVESQRVRVAFFRVGEVRIELLEPTCPESPVAKFIEKKGEGIHHLAYTVEGIEDRIKEIEEEGLRMIDKAPRGGAHGTSIAFLHPKSTGGVLTEICEPGDG